MPAFVIFDSTIGIQTLNSSDRLFVADGAVVTTSIVSSSAGTVAMGNNTQLTVAGTLHSSYGPAVRDLNDTSLSQDIIVAETGVLLGGFGGIRLNQAGGSFHELTVVNHGGIHTQSGAALNLASSFSSITNTGTISSNQSIGISQTIRRGRRSTIPGRSMQPTTAFG